MQDYDVLRIEEFASEMKEALPNITDVMKANWIRPKNSNNTPLLITFAQPWPPKTLTIPGEQTFSTVYEYKERRLWCGNCLEYSHSKKRCTKDPRCRQCSEQGHTEGECENVEIKCYQCKEERFANSKNCLIYKQEEEICQIQNRKKHL